MIPQSTCLMLEFDRSTKDGGVLVVWSRKKTASLYKTLPKRDTYTIYVPDA